LRGSLRGTRTCTSGTWKIVNTILDTITAALARGDRVELRDFGVFVVKERESYTARNPRTGGAVSVGEKAIPTFKTGRNMYRRLNPSSDTSVHSQTKGQDCPLRTRPCARKDEPMNRTRVPSQRPCRPLTGSYDRVLAKY
jgi:nucleoid DNA-binding protein